MLCSQSTLLLRDRLRAVADRPGAACKGQVEDRGQNDIVRVYEVRKGEYTTLYGCRKSTGKHMKLDVLLDDGYVLFGSYSKVRLNRWHVAWFSTFTDISCKAECPPGYDSTKSSIHAADVRTAGPRNRRSRGPASSSAGRGPWPGPVGPARRPVEILFRTQGRARWTASTSTRRRSDQGRSSAGRRRVEQSRVCLIASAIPSPRRTAEKAPSRTACRGRRSPDPALWTPRLPSRWSEFGNGDPTVPASTVTNGTVPSGCGAYGPLNK